MKVSYLTKKISFISHTDVIVFFFAAIFFGSLILSNISDLYLHIVYTEMMAKGELLPPPSFLYYLTVYTVVLFNANLGLLMASGAFILALSVTAKLIVTRLFFTEIYQDICKDSQAPAKVASFFSLLLIVAFSLPTDTPFLGQIPPNVWHNSTTIFLMPFALAAFWLSYRQLCEQKPNRITLLTLICVLSLLAKPSFFMVFVIAYPLMLLKRFGFKKQLWQNLIPVFIGFIVLVSMYYLIYFFNYGNVGGSKANVIFNPFYVWSAYSSNIPRSLLASLVFPATYLALYPKDIFKHILLQYSVVCYLIALSIFALLSESGPRMLHGNLCWQAIVFSYILFVCSSIFFAEKIEKYGMVSWRNIVIALAFLSHIVAGIFYIKYFFQTISL